MSTAHRSMFRDKVFIIRKLTKFLSRFDKVQKTRKRREEEGGKKGRKRRKAGNREVRFELEFTRVSNSLFNSNSLFLQVLSKLDTRPHSLSAYLHKTRSCTRLDHLDSSFTRVVLDIDILPNPCVK